MTISKLIYPLYLSIASRFHGGGLIDNVPRPIRDIIYAAPYMIPFTTSYTHAALAFTFAYVGKNIGHENFWYMATQPTDIQRRSSPIAYVLLRAGLKYDTLIFCTLGMAIKGIIISAGTANPLVIAAHAITFPLSYYLSFKYFKTNVVAEYMTGCCCGLSFFFI